MHEKGRCNKGPVPYLSRGALAERVLESEARREHAYCTRVGHVDVRLGSGLWRDEK